MAPSENEFDTPVYGNSATTQKNQHSEQIAFIDNVPCKKGFNYSEVSEKVSVRCTHLCALLRQNSGQVGHMGAKQHGSPQVPWLPLLGALLTCLFGNS